MKIDTNTILNWFLVLLLSAVIIVNTFICVSVSTSNNSRVTKFFNNQDTTIPSFLLSDQNGNISTLNQNDYLPVGSVIPYAGVTPPQTFLLCDGKAVSRITYSLLFSVISTTYGVGDSTSTFNLPDLRGRTIIGSGTGPSLTNRTINQSGGAETVTLTTAQIPAHNHTGNTSTDGWHTHTMNNNYSSGNTSAAYDESGDGTKSSTDGAGSHSHSLYINNTGGGGAHENMQPFRVLNYIIKCF